jgi:hypothetical protein
LSKELSEGEDVGADLGIEERDVENAIGTAFWIARSRYDKAI